MLMQDLMSQGRQKLRQIHVTEIRPNSLNFFSKNNISVLTNSIEKHGQLSNAIVYEDELEDGKRFTLISGENRWKALLNSYEENNLEGELLCIVVPKPKTEAEEIELIIQSNTQRPLTKNDNIQVIQFYESEYNKLKSEGKLDGIKKDEYIAKFTTVSERTIRNWRKNGLLKTDSSCDEAAEENESLERSFYKTIKRCYKSLSKIQNQITDEQLTTMNNQRLSAIVIDLENYLNSISDIVNNED